MSRIVVIDTEEGVYVYTEDPQDHVLLIDAHEGEILNHQAEVLAGGDIKARLGVGTLPSSGFVGVVYRPDDDYFLTDGEVGRDTVDSWYRIARKLEEGS